MVSNLTRQEEINVLASDADWAWPMALEEIFRPRGVNLLVARQPAEFVSIIESKRIHTTILDTDTRQYSVLATVRIIKAEYPMLPCILLTKQVGKELLGKALELNVSGVVDKPVDMVILRELLDRLFVKRYNSKIFSE
ncbi:MAG: response regulator [Planctomycetota bacterium]